MDSKKAGATSEGVGGRCVIPPFAKEAKDGAPTFVRENNIMSRKVGPPAV